MRTSQLIEHIVDQHLAWEQVGTHRFRPEEIRAAANRVVRVMLEEEPLPESLLCEASVHKSRRSRIYVASFIGCDGNQEWKTTGSRNYVHAMRIARRWEAEARAERARTGASADIRLRLRNPLLTQAETAKFLGLTERGVRAIEKRALWKLRNDPVLRKLWHEFSTGTLEESSVTLTPQEIAALFDLAQTSEELQVIEKIVQWIRRSAYRP